MKHILSFGFLVALVLSNVTYASSEPEEFFEKFIELGHDFDPSVAALYADSARIHADRLYPFGLKRSVEFSGTQWKELARQLMSTAKARNDKSIYSNTVITKLGNGYRIKADRYSVSNCYTDRGYYMVVEQKSDGELSIVEEHLETQPQTSCLRRDSTYR